MVSEAEKLEKVKEFLKNKREEAVKETGNFSGGAYAAYRLQGIIATVDDVLKFLDKLE